MRTITSLSKLPAKTKLAFPLKLSVQLLLWMFECIYIRDQFHIQIGKSKVSLKQASFCFHLTQRKTGLSSSILNKNLAKFTMHRMCPKNICLKNLLEECQFKKKSIFIQLEIERKQGLLKLWRSKGSSYKKSSIKIKTPDIFILKVKFVMKVNESTKDSTMLTLSSKKQ